MLRGFFNQRAAAWDERAAEKDRARLEAMVERLGLKPGSAVLDVGTGTGVLLPFILERVGPGARIIALDFAIEMLKVARSKGIVGAIDCVCADVGHLPIADQVVDGVVCYSSLPHFPDKPRALTECFRILKSGGTIAICHTAGRVAVNAIHLKIPEVRDDLVPDGPEMERMLARAGFENIDIADRPDSYLARAVKP